MIEPLTCRENRRLLEAYVDGELDAARTLALEDHLDACAPCAEALARLRALGTALRRHVELEPAPRALRQRLAARFPAATSRPATLPWRWALALAAPGIAALAITLWLAFSLVGLSLLSNDPSMRVVYHISSTTTARAALRNLSNHLKASPEAEIVVVAHNDGVDFLLQGARDEAGQLFEPEVRQFIERGVDFRVCYNTLERRHIEPIEVIPAATVVPSGIAEISRLQSKEGYTYMRL